MEIAGGLKVTGFNGTEVSWGANGFSGLEDGAWQAVQKGSEWKTTIRIPAGNNRLDANIYLWDYNSYPGYVSGSAYIRASGLEINHNFQPGQTYFLRPVLIVKGLFAREESETVEYSNSGPTAICKGVRLRIDQNGTSVAEGNTIRR